MNQPASSASITRAASDASDSGVILLVLIIVMIPLVALAGAATTLMTGRNNHLLNAVQYAKATLAAEAGMHDALDRAATGTLTPGVTIARDLQDGLQFEMIATLLSNDGLDNDADGVIDETDEQAFEVVVTGSYARALKRLSGVVLLPDLIPSMDAAILCLGLPEIRSSGDSLISGHDTNIDGTRGDPMNDVYGIAITPPDTATDLQGAYVGNGEAEILGTSPSPSLGTASEPFNLRYLLTAARENADVVLTPGTRTGTYGSTAADDYRVVYCDGDLHFSAGSGGAGILVVTGDCMISGTFRWDGLVVVLGRFTGTGGTLINGGLVHGPDGAEITTVGFDTVRYSREALDRIEGVLVPEFLLEGWREISRY